MKERRIPVGEARSNLANLLREAEQGARIELTRYNRTIAALVSQRDLANLADCDERRAGRRRRRWESV